MNQQIRSHVNAMNRAKSFYFYLGLIIKMIRAAILGGISISLWAMLYPEQDHEQMILGLLAFVMALILSTFHRPKIIKSESVLLSLEMDHPEEQKSAFSLKDKTLPEAKSWLQPMARQLKDLISFERNNSVRLASTLVLPALCLFLLGLKAPEGLNNAFSSMRDVVARLSWGAKLTIVEGRAKEDTPKQISLSSSSQPKIDLIEQNMVEIEMIASNQDSAQHTVELRRHKAVKNEVYQSFQMMAVRQGSNDAAALNGKFKVAFAVPESVDLYLPSLSSAPLAQLLVKKLPVPKVSLATIGPLTEPWPDDKPLALRIKVDAENPLRLVRLVIVSGKRSSQELVNNILNSEIKQLETDYDLILEQYVESDIADVEVYAEAVDRSIPKPLVGRSEAIRLRTASAYGRYRQTLSTLKNLKQLLDEAIRENKAQLPSEAQQAMEKAFKQSVDSPFFDGIDRVTINGFRNEVQTLTTRANRLQTIDLSENLNEFLLDHEMLDSRERDRDFFVAIRGLSRLLEQDRQARPVAVDKVTDRIKTFLDERREFWQLRVKRLPPQFQPKSWPRIRNKQPFKKAMNQTAQLDKSNTPEDDSQALIALSKSATDYREWIEKLEEREDRARSEQERQRQQGLANARNILRELQRRQDSISKNLDRSDFQEQSKLSDNWPATRMKQNTNIKGTKTLEAQMRALSPGSSARIKISIDMMEKTLESGNGDRFSGPDGAERFSDLAARALRQAQNAAQRSQRQQSSRGRRRRITGDRYFGKRIIGGDVEFRREYEVDKRYREDILNEVRQSLSNTEENSDEQNRKVLESYLRQVIR